MSDWDNMTNGRLAIVLVVLLCGIGTSWAVDATLPPDINEPILLDSGTNTFTVATGDSGTIFGTIDGRGNLLKLGGGTLLLNVPNSFRGGTIVQEGTLILVDYNAMDADSLENAVIGDGTPGNVHLAGNAALRIGDQGLGALRITDGGLVSSAAGSNISIGHQLGADGRIDVDGIGSELSSGNNLNVGYRGHGLLNITGGGAAHAAASVTIGTSLDPGGKAGYGVIHVSGTGSELSSGSGMQIGLDGIGILRITEGGKAYSAGTSNIYIGDALGHGTVTIDGLGSELSSGGILHVGYKSTGILNITNEGQANSFQNIIIGHDAVSHGTVDISGAGSILSSGSTLHIGYGGTGTLRLLDGGRAESTDTKNVYIGFNTGANGSVEVRGNGSLLKSANALNVGYNGAGKLVVADQGTVSAAAGIYIGYNGAGRGEVLVNAGGKLVSGGSINVGHNTNPSLGFLGGTGEVDASSSLVRIYRTGTLSPGEVPGQTGTLHITGNLQFYSGGTFQIDLPAAAGDNGDRVIVSGTATLNANAIIDLSAMHRSDTVTILQATASAGALPTLFKLNGEDIAGTRAAVAAPSLAWVGDELQLTLTAAGNEYVEWDVAGSGDWNLTDTNWVSSTSQFLDGDAVVFGNGIDGTTSTITVAGSRKVVGGMAIVGDGDWVFDGPIIADDSKSNFDFSSLLPGNPVRAGRLRLDSTGTVLLNGVNEFHRGVDLQNGTLVLANDKALGTYATDGGTPADSRGQLTVSGNAIVETVSDRTLSNRFVVGDAASLTLRIATDTALTIDGVHNTAAGDDGVGAALRLGAGSFQADADGGDLIIQNGSAAFGGAIGGRITTSGTPVSLSFENLASLTLQGNKALHGSGGALSLTSASEATIRFADRTMIQGNTAALSGGGIYFTGDGIADLAFGDGLVLRENRALGGVGGGAVYASDIVDFTGSALISGNLAAGEGGAVYMNGQGTSNRLGFAETDGDIHFTGNKSHILFDGDGNPLSGTGDANSVYLAKNTQLLFAGQRGVLFDDAIHSGTAGGNSLEMSGTGFVQFQGTNLLNPNDTAGGKVSIHSGVFHIARGAAFSTGSGVLTNTFDVNAGGTLAGGGTIHSQRGFVVAGVLDAHERLYVANGDLTQAGTWIGNEIGTLTLDGDMLLDGGRVLVNTGSSNRSDRIDVQGTVSYGGKNTIRLNDTVWNDGDFLIMTAGGGLSELDILDHFYAVDTASITGGLTNRKTARLKAGTAGDGELHLVMISNASIDLTWTGGDLPGTWDKATSENWLTSGTTTPPETFRDGDIVRFDGQGQGNVTLTDDMVVSAMHVTDGSYVFTGGNISAVTGGVIGDLITAGAKLNIGGASTSVTLNNTNNRFEKGVRMSGGELVLGTDTALGTYATDPLVAADSEGQVTVSGDATVKTTADRTLSNRFVVENASLLTFDIANGTVLTIRDVNNTSTTDTLGGAIQNNAGGVGSGLGFFGTGGLVLTGNQAGYGGAVGSDTTGFGGLDLTTRSSLEVANNSAAVSGGGLYADSDTAAWVSLGSAVRIVNNTARGGAGGGIWTSDAFSVSGNALFSGNSAATQGGAVYMKGQSSAFATLIADVGDIYFTGNKSQVNALISGSGTANAIHLEQNTTLNLAGTKAIVFDDPISSGTAGGNSLNMTMDATTGFVQFQGINVLNQRDAAGGKVTLTSGTFHVARGAEFATGSSVPTNTFDVGADGTLAGGGTIRSQQGFVISGTFEAHDKIYVPDTDLTQTGQWNGGDIGTLTLDGDVLLDGSRTLLDLGAGNLSDRIDINGSVDYTASTTNTVVLKNWSLGLFTIMQQTGGDFDLDRFTLDTSLITLGNRQSALLQLDTNTLQLLTTTGDSLELTWTDSNANQEWNTADDNWVVTGTATPEIFNHGDLVRFDGQGQGNITLAAAMTTGGMKVTDGSYVFDGGGIATVTSASAGPQVAPTGRLEIGGVHTVVTLNNTNNRFEKGIRMSGGELVLGSDSALGTYATDEATPADSEGQLTVSGGAAKVTTPADRTISNRFVADNASSLTFAIADGTTLTILGVNNAAAIDDAGGAIQVRSGGNFALTGTGNLHIKGGKAGFGGAVHSESDLDFSSLTSLRIAGNTALQSGGGLHGDGNLTLSGNTLFSGNRAGTSGGAIFMNGSTPSTLTMDTGTVGDILFDDNKAAVRFFAHGGIDPDSGGDNSVHLEKNTTLALAGSRNIYFDDPISSGTAGGNTLTKTGAGFVQFDGDSVLNPDDTSGGLVVVNQGTFRVVQEASFSTGSDAATSTFDVAASGGLAGGGTIRSQQGFVIGGTLSADNQVYEADFSDLSLPGSVSGSIIGTLTLVGDVKLDGAKLEVDLGLSNISDLILVQGDVSYGAISGNNEVKIGNWQDGTFTILKADNELTLGEFTLADYGSLLPGARQRAELQLSADLKELQILASSDDNVNHLWTGAGGLFWNKETASWESTDSGEKVYTFIDGDAVAFAGAAPGTIRLDKGGMRVSGMIVSDGEYTFEGGTIIGTLNPVKGNQVVPTGRLDITGGKATFKNTLDFASGIAIGAAGTLVLADGSSTDDTITIASGGELTFERNGDSSHGGSIEGSGHVTKTGTGRLTLTGTNAYSGGTDILDGTLVGTTSSLQGDIANAGTLVFDQAGDGAYGGTIDGAGHVIKTGAGSVTFDLAQTYTGTTLIEGGTLVLTVADTLKSSSQIDLRSGTLSTAADQTFTEINTSAGTTLDMGGKNLTVDSGAIAGTLTNAADLTKTSDAYLSLETPVVLGGKLDVRAGTLGIVADAATIAIQANAAAFANGTTLDIRSFTGTGYGDVVTLVKSTDAITDPLPNYTVGGAGGADYLTAMIQKGNGDTTIDAVIGLSWYDSSRNDQDQYTEAHGTFTLAGASDSFELDTVLADRSGTFTTGWDGKTLTKAGAGTLKLTGANTYTGGTIITAGTLIGTTTSLQGDIANAGTLVFEQAADGTYAGTLSGTGKLVKDGAGTLSLTGTNGHFGGTEIKAGALRATNAAALGMDEVAIAEKAKLVLEYDGSLQNDVVGLGALETAGNINLLGDHGDHEGLVTVRSGRLGLGDANVTTFISQAGFVIEKGTQLDGNGTIDSLIVRTGATLAPGNSIGRITTAGAAVFETGSTYHVEVDGTRSYTAGETTLSSDRLDVGTTVTVGSDSTLSVSVLGEMAADATKEYLIIDSAGGIDSLFADLKDTVMYEFDQRLGDDGKKLYLSVLRRGGGEEGGFAGLIKQVGTSNAYNAAANVDALVAAGQTAQLGALYDSLANLPNDALVVSEAFAQLHGEAYASGQEATAHMQRRFERLIPSARNHAAVLHGHCDPCQPIAALPKISRWATFTGDITSRESIGRYSAYDLHTGGVAFGMDVAASNRTFVGLALGYDNGYQDFESIRAGSTLDAFRMMLYGGYRCDDWYVDMYGGYTKNWHKTTRHINIGSGATAYAANARARYDDDMASAGFEIGKVMRYGRAALTPSVGMHFLSLETPSFTESDGREARLFVEKSSYQSIRVPVGARLSLDFKSHSRRQIWTPEIRAFYVSEAGDDHAAVRTRFASASSGPSFLAQSGAWGDHSVQLGVGLTGQVSQRIQLGIDYDHEIFEHTDLSELVFSARVFW